MVLQEQLIEDAEVVKVTNKVSALMKTDAKWLCEDGSVNLAVNEVQRTGQVIILQLHADFNEGSYNPFFRVYAINKDGDVEIDQNVDQLNDAIREYQALVSKYS